MSDEDVIIKAKLTEDEYDELLKAAKAAGLTPNNYIRKALTDQAFLDRERQKGTRVVLNGRWGRLRELVS
jgi:mobilization protein NikA